MIKLKPIIRQLQELQLSLGEENKEQFVTIIFKTQKKGIEKVNIKVPDLIRTIFSVIDLGQKRLYGSEIRGNDIVSFVIQDQRGKLLFDSRTYVKSSDKEKLIKDKDLKIPLFKLMGEAEKDAQLNILVLQIAQSFDAPKQIETQKKKDDNGGFKLNLDWLK